MVWGRWCAGDGVRCVSGTGSYGPLLGGWPGVLAELPRPAGPPPAASLEAVVALLAARVAPLRPDLRWALERDLQLLPPGGGDGGLGVLAGVAATQRRRVRVRAGRLARAVGAPLVLRRAVGMLPALRALDDLASARLLVLAGLGEGRACARTVRALMLLFGLPLHPALPAGPVPGAVAGGWAGLLRQVRSRGVLVLRQDVGDAGAWWLAGWDVAVVGRLLVQGRDAASQIVGPVGCQLQACGALPVAELLFGLRRLGPGRPALTGRQLAVWVACQSGLHLQDGLVNQIRPVQLARAQVVLRGCFTDQADTQPRGVMLGRLQAAGYTAGSAKYELVVCPWLRPAGRGWYRLAGGQQDDRTACTRLPREVPVS